MGPHFTAQPVAIPKNKRGRGQAWPRLQPTINTISLQAIVLEETGETPETETHQKN